MAPSLQLLCKYTSVYEFISPWAQGELLPWTESHPATLCWELQK